MRVGAILLVLVLCASFAWGNGEVEVSKKIIDESSFANLEDVIAEHFHLKLNIDFEKRIFTGVQRIKLRTQILLVNTVYLDIEDLKIFNVTSPNGNVLKFEVENPNPNIGQRLKVTIPTKWFEYESFELIIHYETSPNASAVNWLTKEQTSGKKLPFMYTICQSIHARSIAPLQDTPAVKTTYKMEITTPTDIVVRGSGNITHEYIDEEFRHTTIVMNTPVQSYLISLAAGNLIEKQLGVRTFVVAEPEVIYQASIEFSDLEQFLIRAETYLTPYSWEVFRIMVMPPSFPIRGMDNPLMTFVSPTTVVGDKSSVDVVIREICHAWFGNSITNINWSHFWLNEGFSAYVERKVLAYLYGESAAKNYAKIQNDTMFFDIVDIGYSSNFTSLNPQFKGSHPDGYMTSIPYEKGFQFLSYLEKLISHDKMREFILSYVKKFQGKSISTNDFTSHFTGFILENYDSAGAEKILKKIDFDKWINGTGLAPERLDFDTVQYRDTIDLAESFMKKAPDAAAKAKYDKLPVPLKGLFYSHFLKNMSRVPKDVAQLIDTTLGASKEVNAEVSHKWLQVAVKSGLMPSPFDAAKAFVTRFGRTNMVAPIYQAMAGVDAVKAREIYSSVKDFYHPITRKAIEGVIRSSEIEIQYSE